MYSQQYSLNILSWQTKIYGSHQYKTASFLSRPFYHHPLSILFLSHNQPFLSISSLNPLFPSASIFHLPILSLSLPSSSLSQYSILNLTLWSMAIIFFLLWLCSWEVCIYIQTGFKRIKLKLKLYHNELMVYMNFFFFI